MGAELRNKWELAETGLTGNLSANASKHPAFIIEALGS